jgi:hypothetical protein
MTCCGEPAHAWDQFRVASERLPTTIRCLIVGENPGSASATYFYDEGGDVAVRTVLLGGLQGAGIIAEKMVPHSIMGDVGSKDT